MPIQPDFTQDGKRLSTKSLRATELLLHIEREQRDRDQSRLARVIIVALEDGIKIAGIAISDDPYERNFLRRVVYHYERDRVLALKGLVPLGMEFEDEQPNAQISGPADKDPSKAEAAPVAGSTAPPC